jgi:hypothetical protein
VRATWHYPLCTLQHAHASAPSNQETALLRARPSRHPTFTDVLLKQDEAGPWPSASVAHQAVPAGGPAGTLAAGPTSSSSSPQHSLPSPETGADGGAAGGEQENFRCDPQQQHGPSALVVTHYILGKGKCGGVVQGRCVPAGAGFEP